MHELGKVYCGSALPLSLELTAAPLCSNDLSRLGSFMNPFKRITANLYNEKTNKYI